jgi:hypothetical protein
VKAVKLHSSPAKAGAHAPKGIEKRKTRKRLVAAKAGKPCILDAVIRRGTPAAQVFPGFPKPTCLRLLDSGSKRRSALSAKERKMFAAVICLASRPPALPERGPRNARAGAADATLQLLGHDPMPQALGRKSIGALVNGAALS